MKLKNRKLLFQIGIIDAILQTLFIKEERILDKLTCEQKKYLENNDYILKEVKTLLSIEKQLENKIFNFCRRDGEFMLKYQKPILQSFYFYENVTDSEIMLYKKGKKLPKFKLERILLVKRVKTKLGGEINNKTKHN